MMSKTWRRQSSVEWASRAVVDLCDENLAWPTRWRRWRARSDDDFREAVAKANELHAAGDMFASPNSLWKLAGHGGRVRRRGRQHSSACMTFFDLWDRNQAWTTGGIARAPQLTCLTMFRAQVPPPLGFLRLFDKKNRHRWIKRAMIPTSTRAVACAWAYHSPPSPSKTKFVRGQLFRREQCHHLITRGSDLGGDLGEVTTLPAEFLGGQLFQQSSAPGTAALELHNNATTVMWRQHAKSAFRTTTTQGKDTSTHCGAKQRKATWNKTPFFASQLHKENDNNRRKRNNQMKTVLQDTSHTRNKIEHFVHTCIDQRLHDLVEVDHAVDTIVPVQQLRRGLSMTEIAPRGVPGALSCEISEAHLSWPCSSTPSGCRETCVFVAGKQHYALQGQACLAIFPRRISLSPALLQLLPPQQYAGAPLRELPVPLRLGEVTLHDFHLDLLFSCNERRTVALALLVRLLAVCKIINKESTNLTSEIGFWQTSGCALGKGRCLA